MFPGIFSEAEYLKAGVIRVASWANGRAAKSRRTPWFLLSRRRLAQRMPTLRNAIPDTARKARVKEGLIALTGGLRATGTVCDRQINLPISQKQSAKIAVEVSGTESSVWRTRILKSPGSHPMPKRARRGNTAENTIDARTKTNSHLSILGLYCTGL